MARSKTQLPGSQLSREQQRAKKRLFSTRQAGKCSKELETWTDFLFCRCVQVTFFKWLGNTNTSLGEPSDIIMIHIIHYDLIQSVPNIWTAASVYDPKPVCISVCVCVCVCVGVCVCVCVCLCVWIMVARITEPWSSAVVSCSGFYSLHRKVWRVIS